MTTLLSFLPDQKWMIYKCFESISTSPNFDRLEITTGTYDTPEISEKQWLAIYNPIKNTNPFGFEHEDMSAPLMVNLLADTILGPFTENTDCSDNSIKLSICHGTPKKFIIALADTHPQLAVDLMSEKYVYAFRINN